MNQVAKHLQVKAWVQRQNLPFTLERTHQTCKCSISTASRALERHFNGELMYTYRHKPNSRRIFYKIFAPITWTPDQFRRYLNNQTRSGKSKAEIFIMGKGKITP